jgi:hypothetical protein
MHHAEAIARYNLLHAFSVRRVTSSVFMPTRCCCTFLSKAARNPVARLSSHPITFIRGGLVYSHREGAKVSLLGTFVDRLFGDGNNSNERVLPRYAVWDLTTEIQISRRRIR